MTNAQTNNARTNEMAARAFYAEKQSVRLDGRAHYTLCSDSPKRVNAVYAVVVR